MSVQAYVSTFVTPTGGTLGAHTVTGIVDSAGAAFTPKAIVVWGFTSGTTDDAFQQDEWDSFGVDDGVTHVGQVIESRWFASVPWRGASCTTSYSILQVAAVFSAGYRLRGYVSSFGSGSFTYTLDQNDDGLQVYGFLALGGSDLQAKVVLSSSGTTVGSDFTCTGLGFAPTGAIFVNHLSLGPYNDGFGTLLAVGWADTALTQYGMASALKEGGTSAAAYASLHSGVVFVENDNTVPNATDRFAVTSWDADGFSGSGSTVSFGALVLGGVTTVAGTFDERSSDSSTTVSIPGIQPAAILLGSVGATASAGSTIAPNESWSVGAYDGTRSWSYWHGALLGSDVNTNGGAHDGQAQALILKRNNGPHSSDAVAVGTLTGTALGDGSFTGTWTNTDGTARAIMYFAFGPPSGPPPPPPAPARGIRRQRIVALPFEHNLKVFIDRLELFCQMGMGLVSGQGSDPVVMVQLSKDGGFSWGSEFQLSVGPMGGYRRRCFLNRLGAGRQWVVKLTMTDPVFSSWLDVWVDVDLGTQ